MAVGQAILVEQISANYNENLLPYFSTFNEEYTWNITDGSSAVIENSPLRRATGDMSMLVTFTGTSETVFEASGEALTTIIPYDGTYTLSMGYWVDSDHNSALFGMTIIVFVNGIATDLTTYNADLNPDEGFLFDKWNIYAQKIQLNKDDEVTFAFKAISDTIGVKLFADMFMLTVDDKKEGLVSAYKLPDKTEIYATATLDFPSIAHNDTHTLTATVTGAKVGDFVQVVPPVAVATNKLICNAIVTADNTVTVIISNNGGGSVNLDSADFKFYLTRR